MLYYLVMAVFIIVCLILGFFVLIQQGKGDMGLGTMGGGSQTLFGGSGGQSFFEKSTWVLGLLFMGISLAFSVWQVGESRIGKSYQKPAAAAPVAPAPASESPTTPVEENGASAPAQ